MDDEDEDAALDFSLLDGLVDDADESDDVELDVVEPFDDESLDDAVDVEDVLLPESFT